MTLFQYNKLIHLKVKLQGCFLISLCISIDRIRHEKTSELFDSLRYALFGLISVQGYKWSWRDLNPRPNVESMSFLHA